MVQIHHFDRYRCPQDLELCWQKIHTKKRQNLRMSVGVQSCPPLWSKLYLEKKKTTKCIKPIRQCGSLSSHVIFKSQSRPTWLPSSAILHRHIPVSNVKKKTVWLVYASWEDSSRISFCLQVHYSIWSIAQNQSEPNHAQVVCSIYSLPSQWSWDSSHRLSVRGILDQFTPVPSGSSSSICMIRDAKTGVTPFFNFVRQLVF